MLSTGLILIEINVYLITRLHLCLNQKPSKALKTEV